VCCSPVSRSGGPSLDGIKGGYLAPATRLKIKTGVDTSGVKSQAGDYNEKQLISVLDASNWVSLAIDAFNEHAGERQTLAFFPKVDMSREFARRLSEAGIPAAHIDANTPKDERGDVLRRYQRGEIRVVSNMGVLTEGFDAPQTSAILMARPTRSETLFTQIIGRGLRLYPGKQDCLIIDLTVVDTKVLEVGTILGQMADCTTCGTQFWKGLKHCPKCGADADSAVPNTKSCPQCGEEIARNAKVCPHCGYIIPRVVLPPDFKGTGEGLQAEVADLFHNMSSAWYGDPDGTFSCSAGFDGAAMVILPPSFAGNDTRLKERIQSGYAMLRAIEQGKCDPDIREALLEQIAMLERELHRIDQYSLYYVPPELKDPLTKKPLPNQLPVRYVRVNADLASLMQEADSEASRYGGLAADKSAGWRSDLASEGQRYYLRSLGAKKLAKELTKGEAGTLITHLKAVRAVRSFVAEDSLTEPVEK
jgi:ribosomal protein L32